MYRPIRTLKNSIAKLSNLGIYYFCQLTFDYFLISSFCFLSDNLTFWALLLLFYMHAKKKNCDCLSEYKYVYTRVRVFTREKGDAKDTEVYANRCITRLLTKGRSRLVHIYYMYIFLFFQPWRIKYLLVYSLIRFNFYRVHNVFTTSQVSKNKK